MLITSAWCISLSMSFVLFFLCVIRTVLTESPSLRAISLSAVDWERTRFCNADIFFFEISLSQHLRRGHNFFTTTFFKNGQPQKNKSPLPTSDNPAVSLSLKKIFSNLFQTKLRWGDKLNRCKRGNLSVGTTSKKSSARHRHHCRKSFLCAGR